MQSWQKTAKSASGYESYFSSSRWMKYNLHALEVAWEQRPVATLETDSII